MLLRNAIYQCNLAIERGPGPLEFQLFTSTDTDSSQAPAKFSLPHTFRGFSVSQLCKNLSVSESKVTSWQVCPAKDAGLVSVSVQSCSPRRRKMPENWLWVFAV